MAQQENAVFEQVAKSMGLDGIPAKALARMLTMPPPMPRAESKPVVQLAADPSLAPAKAAPSNAWLWPGRVAANELTLLAGDPGVGKSLVTLDLAARVSRGDVLPGAAAMPAVEPGRVMIMSGEDTMDTIRRRLAAAQANLQHIILFDGVIRAGTDFTDSADLQKDLLPVIKAMRDVWQSPGPPLRLLIIDPIAAFMGSVDCNRHGSVRKVLANLSMLANRRHLAVVAVTHLNKDAARRTHPLYRATGSLAFTAAARAVHLFCNDPDEPDRRLMLPIKNNLAAQDTGLAYSVVERDATAVVAWEPGVVPCRRGQVIDELTELPSGRAAPVMQQAVDWLAKALAAGAVPATELFEQAQAHGWSVPTLRRAKTCLGAAVERQGGRDGVWVWRLPATGMSQQTA